MTALDTRLRNASRDGVDGAGVADPTVADRTAAQRVVRIATIALVVGLVVAGVFELFEGPGRRVVLDPPASARVAVRGAAVRTPGRGAAIALLAGAEPRHESRRRRRRCTAATAQRSRSPDRYAAPRRGRQQRHRRSPHAWGGPLADLAQLKRGDHIAVQTESTGGPIGVFKVQSVDTRRRRRSDAVRRIRPIGGSRSSPAPVVAIPIAGSSSPRSRGPSAGRRRRRRRSARPRPPAPRCGTAM